MQWWMWEQSRGDSWWIEQETIDIPLHEWILGDKSEWVTFQKGIMFSEKKLKHGS